MLNGNFTSVFCFDKDIDVSSLEPDLLVLMVSKMEKNKDLSPYFKYNEKQLNEKSNCIYIIDTTCK